MKIRDSVKKVLLEECLLIPGVRILTGVSGGPDSMCLLDLLCRLDYDVIVAHVDHSLRPESAAEASKVEGEAKKRGLTFITRRIDVKALAGDEKLSLEEAARTVRYKFLFEQAEQLHAAAVAVAHTADDQVETVLMHLLRGSGLAGLKGMVYRSVPSEWNAEIPLIRPLLGVWRSDVEDYCHQNGLEAVTDASNLDTTYFRNRLRHELIPYLAGYNPQIKNILWRTAQNLAGDYHEQQRQVEQVWDECGVNLRDGAVIFTLEIEKQSVAIKRQLLRRAVACLRPALRDVDFAAIERGVAFFKDPMVDRQVDLVDGLSLKADYEKIYLYDQSSPVDFETFPSLPSQQEIELTLPGTVSLSRGWQIDLQELGEQIDFNDIIQENPNIAHVDADELEFPLVIRKRLPGDRFQPLGMQGKSIKLSDYWINKRLPRTARELYPLVISGKRIAWIPGYRLADYCRVKDTTKRVARLRLIQPTNR